MTEQHIKLGDRITHVERLLEHITVELSRLASHRSMYAASSKTPSIYLPEVILTPVNDGQLLSSIIETVPLQKYEPSTGAGVEKVIEPATETISDKLPTPPPPESLVAVLSSSQTSGWLSKENTLFAAYKKYLDNYFSVNVLQSQDPILTDYRIIPLTLEFISAASKDILNLSGKTTMTLEVATVTALWLIQKYTVDGDEPVPFLFPHNISLLIKILYDVAGHKYSFESVSPEIDAIKKRTSILGKYKLRFSTVKLRWTKRKSGCLPGGQGVA